VTTLLLVGGTGEARALAAVLDGTPGLRVVSSLAGAVARPRLPVGEVRVGGFGGPDGLARWMTEHRVAAVVDASHPFAARISASCVTAASSTGVPLLRLERPAWTASPDDDWRLVPDVVAAAALLPELLSEGLSERPSDLPRERLSDLPRERASGPAGRCGRLLLTTGRRDLPAFYDVPGVSIVARCVDPPVDAVPPHVEILLDRGTYTVEGETELLRSRAIDVLVTKNSGGALTEAKLVAARSLRLPVVMVERPRAARPPAVVHDVDAAAAWVRGLLP
jgi:precorrin-6A/cobalt-precorrin-6A reductase